MRRFVSCLTSGCNPAPGTYQGEIAWNEPGHYPASFFDVTSGNNALYVPGFSAGPGWDPATGLGSPTADQLVNYLIQFVSPGDAVAAVNGSKPHPVGNPSAPGHQRPH
ncbi:MAG TPA: hypothetical protein VMJ75_02815 [Candidatus Acidoferrales bacterium]|nr:hypothetical protein [Candidatus Acidoferrales bacterium]